MTKLTYYTLQDAVQDASNPAVFYGFFGCQGGYSTGAYASLNCGIYTDDDPSIVKANIELIRQFVNTNCKMIGRNEAFSTLKLVHQVHGNTPIYVNHAEQSTEVDADAMVTSTHCILLAVQTADCVPILLWDKNAKIIAAIHSGWRGAVAGVIQNTISMMYRSSSRDPEIIAIIGPAIRFKNYIVGREFYDNLTNINAKNATYFVKNDTYNINIRHNIPEKHKDIHGEYKFNLVSYCHDVLAEHCSQVYDTGLDTYTGTNIFFSHRRATLTNNVCGRQLSVIGLLEKDGA